MSQTEGFRQLITAEEELNALFGPPSAMVTRKVIPYIDHHCRSFIAQSPFLVIATADDKGLSDASPRGDAPGFVMVKDEKHLVIPERPGNKRMDSMRNILSNGHIGLLFLIPGLEETLRINGKACLIRDEDVLAQLAVNGKVPVIGIGVEVTECFVHCAKAFKRSGLWSPDSWPAKDRLPSPAQMLADHVKDMSVEEVEASLRESYSKRLY